MTNAELAQSIAAVEAENFDLMPDGYPTDEQLAAYDPATMATPLMDESSLMAPPYMDQTAAPASQQVINITSQEQFDALPEFQKGIIRAQASGATISAKSQEQLAVDAIKQNLKPESKAGTIEVVKDPVTGEEIRIFNSSDGSAYPMPTPEPVKMEKIINKDTGQVFWGNSYDGTVIPARDKETGDFIYAGTSNQSGNDDVRLRRMMLQNKLDQANKSVLDYEQRVARGDTPWHSGLPLVGSGATYENDLRAALAARDELTRQMGQLGAASAPATQDTMPTEDMPPPEPAQTPQPTPQPTPQQTPQPPDPRPMPENTPRSASYSSPAEVQAAYKSGEISRTEALKILQTEYNYK